MTKREAIRINKQELSQFYAQNPDFSILDFDLYDRKQLSTLNWEGVNDQSALEEMRVYQRLLRLHPDQNTAELLRSKGLDSAHKIAAMPEHKFVREFKTLFDGDEARALSIHRNAVRVKANLKHVWANVRDLVASHHYKATLAYNTNSEMINYFQSIPDYEDLFGSTDYLKCEHCRSILGPAAYFVDIMRITDQYITDLTRKRSPRVSNCKSGGPTCSLSRSTASRRLRSSLIFRSSTKFSYARSSRIMSARSSRIRRLKLIKSSPRRVTRSTSLSIYRLSSCAFTWAR